MGPKLSVSERVELDREGAADRSMNHVRYARSVVSEPAHAGSADVHSTAARISRARIISCENDPAARLRRPRPALPAPPFSRPEGRGPLPPQAAERWLPPTRTLPPAR